MSNPSQPIHWEEMHHRLVSLWELLMDVFPAEKFLHAFQQLSAFSQLTSILQSSGMNAAKMPEHQFLALKSQAEALKLSLLGAGMEISAASAERILEEMQKVEIEGGTATIDRFVISRLDTFTSQLVSRVPDEIKEKFVLIVPASEKTLYNDAINMFGQTVERTFPNASEDIAEAGKCLALNGGTACVFHLMRVMENAVQVMGASLNVTLIDKHNKELAWGPLLSNLNCAIQKMLKGRQRDQWSEAYTLLYHVKQAWRNDTMHPNQTYTREEAKAILDAVRIFMNDLAYLF
jgi:hypothetical protein